MMSMSLCPGWGHGIWLENSSPSFIALFLLSAHHCLSEVSEGAGPLLAGGAGPSSHSEDSQPHCHSLCHLGQGGFCLPHSPDPFPSPDLQGLPSTVLETW